MHFSDINKWLSSANLNYACSANLLDSVEVLNLTKDQSEFLKTITDLSFRETTRDFLLNQLCRKVYRVKAPRTIDPIA